MRRLQFFECSYPQIQFPTNEAWAKSLGVIASAAAEEDVTWSYNIVEPSEESNERGIEFWAHNGSWQLDCLYEFFDESWDEPGHFLAVWRGASSPAGGCSSEQSKAELEKFLQWLCDLAKSCGAKVEE